MTWRDRAGRGIDWLGVPVIAFVGVQAVTVLAAMSTGLSPWRTLTWKHWDAGHYNAIALQGYSEGSWGWFPGVPWSTIPLQWLDIAPATTMLVLARVFTLAMLVVVWRWLLDREHTVEAYVGMAFAAFCPGAVYFHAVFPMAEAAFFVCAMFAALRHQRYGWAAVAGFLGATTYSLLPLLGPVAAAWILLGRYDRPIPAPPWAMRIRRALLIAASATAGALLVVVVMRVQSGRWDGFLEVQEGYHYVTRFPLLHWHDTARAAWSGASGIEAVQALQACLVLGLLVVLWISELRHGLRELRGTPLLVLGWITVVWAVPLTLGQRSIWRTDSLLVPAAVLVARLPRPVAALVVFGGIALLSPMVVHYIENTLV